MAEQLKTGAAQTTSMSEFLAKAKKLADAKPIVPSSSGPSRNFGAAKRKTWSRAGDARGQEPAGEASPAPDAAQDEGEA